jgi:formate C-acetyltransferase
MLETKVSYHDDKFRLPITPRIKKMREEIVEAKPILCSERAILVTESYKETENEPAVIRRAKALKKVLENMTINIWDGELIVGNHGGNGRRSAPVFPEWGTYWLEKELDEILETRPQDRFIVPQKVKDDLKSIFPYWKGKTVYERYRAILPEETKKARDAYIFTRDLFERGGYGHVAYDTPKVLKVGFKGIKEEILEKLRKLEKTCAEDQQKRLFYEALLITSDAIINFAHRFSEKAKSLAATETNPTRKKELEKISEVCAWVPENPPRDFWEAIQTAWFLQLVVQIESNGNSVSPGRLDQYLYPFYSKDIEEGKLTIAEAQELIDCFWLKLNEIIKVWDKEATRVHPGFPMTQDVTIGGQTPEGYDATNDLSYLMLNAQEHIRLQNPQFTVRIHRNTPDEFIMRVAEVVRLGTGMPAMFGDEICIPAIIRTTGVPLERARDYRIVGCVELTPRGLQGRANGAYFNVARIVDLAINDGVDRLTGEKIRPSTGDPNNFKTFEEVIDAVKKQMKYFIEQNVINNLIVDMVQRELTPHVFLSSIVEGCIEKGKDITWGGSLYGVTPIQCVGMATAADSLAAIKKVIFDDKKITMAELNKVLDSDFEGEKGEQIRKILLNAPKYGNDDDEADRWVREITNIFFDEVESHKDIDGRPYTNFILTLGSTVPHGWRTGATADGRKAKTPVSDSMSPTNGADKNGPTAVLKSASKIDQIRIMQGNVLNLKFSRTALEGDMALRKFVQLVRTYLIDLKGMELQVNVVDAATLRDAQRHPEKYQDLIIRVAGYSARFVELAKELQDDLIARTEHSMI